LRVYLRRVRKDEDRMDFVFVKADEKKKSWNRDI
jgi:hypothetical protein